MGLGGEMKNCKKLLGFLLLTLFIPIKAYSIDQKQLVIAGLIRKCFKDPQSEFGDKQIKDVKLMTSSLWVPKPRNEEGVGVSKDDDSSNDWFIYQYNWRLKSKPEADWQKATVSFYVSFNKGFINFSKGVHSKDCKYTKDLNEPKSAIDNSDELFTPTKRKHR
jgi:hypothetical protein